MRSGPQTLNISGGRGGNGGKGGGQGGSGGTGEGPSLYYDIKAERLDNLTFNNITQRVLGRKQATFGGSEQPVPNPGPTHSSALVESPYSARGQTSFGSNAGQFTLRKGVSNNIHGNVVHNTFFNYGRKRHQEDIESETPFSPEPVEEDEEDIEHLKLSREIGRGPGYHFSEGKIKGRAVIVQVFDRGPTQRKRFESTVSLSKGLMHPNLLRIKATSSPTSRINFIAYENAFWQYAAGPLATALTEDLDRSVILGFKMISQLAQGMNYIYDQGISFASLGSENFDIFLDQNDRFLICINPSTSDQKGASQDRLEQDDDVWEVFNGLCKKVLKTANSRLHQEDIDRQPAVLVLSNAFPRLLPPSEPNSLESDEDPASSSVTPRREFVWRTIDRGTQSLDTVADRFTRVLDMKRSSINKISWTDVRSTHRCPGYVREEITLAATAVDSAVITHDAPSQREVCSICHQLVGDEDFRCICGDPFPGSYTTVKCQSCKFWSHRDCVGSQREFICHLCKAAGAADSESEADSSLSSASSPSQDEVGEPNVNRGDAPANAFIPLEVPEEWYETLDRYDSSGREITNAVRTAERLALFAGKPLILEDLEKLLKSQVDFAKVL
ncbi:hypothetical protein MSAN_02232500 [Mycena sanguinolenta]|uniref:Protein kinase domain-containing protein n=1 Tax=Mycena sanguinolenta TaxID=230812 RepID=A0A8H6XAQ5_9AGAR|nr:hypothetical protein MSAN_02232500 [Mycena sanguinolenta]